MKPHPDLRRVLVVGSSCCGKTTFARQLAAQLKCSHIELDALFWMPDWAQRDVGEFRQKVEEAAAAVCWVIDGNYGAVRETIWPHATTVIWLDYSFATIFRRAVMRTVRRMFSREVLYSGNRESFARAFFTRDSILWWVITTFHKRRRAYRDLRNAAAFPRLQWVEFHKPGDAQRFLQGLRSP